MESIVKSDIFFFVTTVCVFVITALIVMILANILHVTKSVREIVDKMKGEVDGVTSDVAAFRTMLRAKIQEGQFGLKPILESLKKKKAEVVKTARARVKKVKKAVVAMAEDINH